MERLEYERMHAVEDRMWWYRGLRKLVAGLLVRALSQANGASASGAPVLDAGCGTGGMLRLLGHAVAGHPTIGLEFDSVAASLAAAKAERPVAVGSVNEMPLADRTLKGYVSLDVLCHDAVDPAAALKEVHRCLRPGGIALFNLPAYRWLLSAHDRRVHNARRFVMGEARALLTEHGFRILLASYWNTLLLPLMILHRMMERPEAPSDVRDYPAWLDALFSAALAIERTAIFAGLRLPFGGSLILVAIRDD